MRGSRGGNIPVERRRRDAEAVRNLRDADIGIGKQCPRSLKIVLCQPIWICYPDVTPKLDRLEPSL